MPFIVPGRAQFVALVAICAAFWPTMQATQAQDIVSHYTSTAEKACKTVGKSKPDQGDWSVQRCPGRDGYVVRVAEDDLRTSVSAGRTLAAAENEPAATQTFPSFNSVHDTLEWRSAKDGAPFALIQRWRLADNENPDSKGRPQNVGLLVVTRLPPGPVCHVAYVDVRANGSEANALARKAADEGARDFKCGSDTIRFIGQRGRAAALAGIKGENP